MTVTGFARPAGSGDRAVQSVSMATKPDVTVAAIVMRDDRFLLVEERVARRLVLNQPAGHLEGGETLVQAVVREALDRKSVV